MSEGIEVAKKLPVTDDIREAMATIRRGTDSFLIEEEFEQKLARSKATGKPLRCKLGLDPTAPDNPSSNSWDPATGRLVIDDFTPGYLSSAISNLVGDRSAIRSLTVIGTASESMRRQTPPLAKSPPDAPRLSSFSPLFSIAILFRSKFISRSFAGSRSEICVFCHLKFTSHRKLSLVLPIQ